MPGLLVSGLKFYQNPVKNEFTVSVNNARVLNVKVFDMLGKEKLLLHGAKNTYIFKEKAGVYLALIQTDKGFYNEVFIKE